MKENNTGLMSNLQIIDNRHIDSSEYEDIPELPKEFFADGQLYRNGRPIDRRSRGQQKLPTKKQLTIRLSSEIVDFFKAQGKGWQTKLNDVLQKYVDSHHVS